MVRRSNSAHYRSQRLSNAALAALSRILRDGPGIRDHRFDPIGKKAGCSPQGEALLDRRRLFALMEGKDNVATTPSKLCAELGESAWCALYTRHQHEKGVAQALTCKGFEVLLPLYNSVRRWKDRRKLLSLPLFPGYVFVRGGITRRLQIVTTPGVHMILCTGDHVAVIPEAEIEAIRKAVNGPYRIEPHPFLKCGDRVRVKRGALEGVDGILVRKKNLCRLVLSIDLLAKSVGLEIDAADVEPLPKPGIVPLHLRTAYQSTASWPYATTR
jgi:transcription antitermination factor NusG